jgi:hypothetical protein
MTSSHPTAALCQWFSQPAAALDRRSARRPALVVPWGGPGPGAADCHGLDQGPKLSDRFPSCSIAVAAAGKRSDRIARRLLTEVVAPLFGGAERLTLAPDDTRTKRYGPHVQGAGVRHNPTPGPAGSPDV